MRPHIFTFILFALSSNAFAFADLGCPTPSEPLFPHAIWESNEIKSDITSFAYGDVDGDFVNEIVYVSNEGLVVADIGCANVRTLIVYRGDGGTQWLRVFAGDWDSDGRVEILTNVFVNNQVITQMFVLVGAIHESPSLKIKKEFDALVVPLNINQTEKLFAQKWLGAGRWSNTASSLALKDGKWVEDSSKIILHRGLSDNTVSLLSMTVMGDHVVRLTGDKKIVIQDLEGKSIWKSAISYGSIGSVLNWQGKDALGVRQASDQIIPVRLIANGSDVVVVTSDDFLKSMIGTVPSVVSSRVVFLTRSRDGLIERAGLPNVSGAIVDAQVVDFNNDGIFELLVAFQQPQTLSGYKKARTVFALVGMP